MDYPPRYLFGVSPKPSGGVFFLASSSEVGIHTANDYIWSEIGMLIMELYLLKCEMWMGLGCKLDIVGITGGPCCYGGVWLSPPPLLANSFPLNWQQHEVLLPNGQRAGFLIGDGAGVGKGRTVAGIIFENYLKGRKKSLWYVTWCFNPLSPSVLSSTWSFLELPPENIQQPVVDIFQQLFVGIWE